MARAEVDVVRAALHDNEAMSDPDIAILLSVANDYDAAGPQFATLAALMRRVAHKLQNAGNTENAEDTAIAAIAAADCLVVDGDDPVFRGPCINCGDE